MRLCPRKSGLWLALLLLCLALALTGCKAKEPPLSPKAAAFKKEVRQVIANLVPALKAPLAQGDAKAAGQAVLSLYPTAGQEKEDFPFRVFVLDRDGVILTTLPVIKAAEGADFAQYQIVQEVLNTRRLGKVRLYMPDGTPIFIIAAPVVSEDKVIGLLGLRVTAAQAEKKWGITEPEFVALDLN